MAIPKETRQRMINVMYIVLLALLALQIPKEVTQAFIKINDGIETSNVTIDGINNATLEGLKEKGKKDEDAAKYALLAEEVRIKVADLNKFIDGIKNNIVETIGVDEKTGKIQSPEEVNLTSEILIKGEENGTNDGVAFELEKKINETKEAILALLPKQEMEDYKKGMYEETKNALPLNTEFDASAGGEHGKKDEGPSTWAMDKFDHMPAAGAMAMLSQIQADASATENKVVETLKQMVGLDRVELDQFRAAIVAPSSYVLRGQKMEAGIFLAASSSNTSNVTISANGQNLAIGKDGVAIYNGTTSTTGEKTVNAVVSVTNKKGEVTEYKETFKYTVADPFANVTPTKMNVFYIGVDNPVTASAAGVLARDLRVNMSEGTLTGSGGNYNVRVTKQGTSTITVADASGTRYGNFEFRVKRIPDPVAQVARKSGGNISAGEFQVQKGLAAVLENFDFDAKFDVVSYDLVYIPKRQDLALAKANGATFTGQMAGYIQKAKPGDVYAFENITVRGPDGQTRGIPGINFRIR
ncbi:MAG: gliding motility protein GldM [Chitinophagales bacterium]